MRAKHLKEAKKVAIMKKLAAFLFIYIIFFTTYFSMITLSKYTGVSTGTGTITTAKWDVSIDSSTTNSTLDIVEGNGAQDYILKVKSKSEVGADYSIILSDLPNEIEVSIDGGDYQTPINNKINVIGSFDANDVNSEHNYTLSFRAPLNSDIPNVNEINLDIKFVQKQL